jgi:hypothetical protein
MAFYGFQGPLSMINVASAVRRITTFAYLMANDSIPFLRRIILPHLIV